MPLSYDWSSLTQLVADLKSLVALGVGSRLETLEAKPEYDDVPLKLRVSIVEEALAQSSGTGVDAGTLARIAALEESIGALSVQLAAYAPAPIQ